jgi:hypothetical protein
VPGAAEVLHTLQKQNHPWAIVTSAWRIGDFRDVVAIRREGEFLKIELRDRSHGVAERGADASL